MRQAERTHGVVDADRGDRGRRDIVGRRERRNASTCRHRDEVKPALVDEAPVGLVAAARAKGDLSFFGDLAQLADPVAFKDHLAPLRRCEWVVFAKRPFGGPAAVLAYLARYTHRVAISNSRLIALDERGVTFSWKDYRARSTAAGDGWIKTMTLPADEFLRRFLLHVLPDGFHRIRHYGLLASGQRAANVRRVRELIGSAQDPDPPDTASPTASAAKPTWWTTRPLKRLGTAD